MRKLDSYVWDRILSRVFEACRKTVSAHFEKGEVHSEKSLRYYRAGFEAGWRQAIAEMKKEIAGD